MYEYIKGTVTSKQTDSYRGNYIVLEANNIGYFIAAGKRSVEKLQIGDEVKIYLSLIHREDLMSLIGFLTKEERDIFNILQSVSGVGVKTALIICDEFSSFELLDIMLREDAKELSRAKGVGAKVAQKIIIEVKDKLLNKSKITPVDIPDTKGFDSEIFSEVQSVLISLGYSLEESKNAIKEIINYKKDLNDTESVLKYTLEYLSRQE